MSTGPAELGDFICLNLTFSGMTAVSFKLDAVILRPLEAIEGKWGILL